MRYEKWSLGYWIFKQYVNFFDWLVHSKTAVSGRENIPENKPILFSPNHQNALSDPLAILLNTKYQPVWLARADIFDRSKLINFLLRFFKIMPVYRMQDGKENLSKNEKTFGDSVKVLEHNFALGLFPEAAHSRRRQMLVHKKAVPRIVFMALEKTNNELDIQIVPTGIYYSHYWKFGRELLVNFGKPIAAKKYIEAYKENPFNATLSLQKEVYEAMVPLSLDIRSKSHYADFENIRGLYGETYAKKKGLKPTIYNQFRSDQELCAKLDAFEKANPEETEQLAASAGSYLNDLKKFKIRNWLVDSKKNLISIALFNIILLIIGFPLFALGFLFNAIPFFIVDKVIRKKVKDVSFWSSFFFVLGIIVFPICYLIEFIVFTWFLPELWMKLAILVLMPLSGKFAFNWYIFLRKTVGRFRMLNLKWFSKEIYNNLLNKKHQLYNNIEKVL